jgi:thymidylate synthase
MSNNEEKAYLDILRDLLTKGDERQTRNSITKTLFSRNLTFDLKNSFPLLTTKKMFFRGIFEELMFFIRGDTDTKILEEKGVKIWKDNTTRSFLDNVGLNHYQEGDMGPMYGYQLRFFNAEYNGCNYNSCNSNSSSNNNNNLKKGIDQLKYVIDTILKDPFSRRIIMTTFNPAQVNEGCLFPCHSLMIQFYIRKENDTYYLSQQNYIRSNDMFLGNPYNIASFALMSYLLCHHLNHLTKSNNYKPDMLHITLGDYHLYKDHYEVAQEQIDRIPYSFPQLNIKNYHENIEDYQYDDIELINYMSHPVIKTRMIA